MPEIVIEANRSIDWGSVARQGADFVPFVGSGLDIYEGVRDGNGWQIATGVGGMILDATTMGAGGAIVKGSAKALLKEGAEQGVKAVSQYTKSNLKLGQQMHKNYKAGVTDNVTTFKEFRLPSRKRVDFLDIENGIIYELKPFNPRAMKAGQKQLDIYLKELQTIPRFKDTQWKTILDTY